MDTFALFFLLVVLVLVVLVVSRPFIQSRRKSLPAGPDHELSSLMAERDRAVNSLNELDFDYALGKIPAEDYPAQREILLKRGADVLRRIDELQPSSYSGQSAESRMEVAIAARRADMSAQPAQPEADLSDDDIENMISLRRNAHQEKSGGFCPKCGRAVLKSDKFCPNCGNNI